MTDYNEVAAPELVRNYSSSRCRDNYELYVSFLCVFACIYALAKVAHIAERYLARQMYGKFYTYNQNAIDRETTQPTTKNNSEEALRLRINKLTRQNLELKLEVSRSKNCDAGHVSKIVLPPGDGILQNVYISNKHVSLNHKVYVSGDAVLQNFHNFPEKVNDVWQSYLDMQRESHLRTSSLWANIKRESYVPVMFSTEDLQKFHGNNQIAFQYHTICKMILHFRTHLNSTDKLQHQYIYFLFVCGNLELICLNNAYIRDLVILSQ